MGGETMVRSIRTSVPADIRAPAGGFALAVLLVGATPAAAEQMVFFGSAAEDHHVDLGQKGGVGNMILWHADLEDEQGSAVGTTSGRCLQVDDEGTQLCNIILDHAGHGRINLNGIQKTEPTFSTHTIIGGTEDYAGVRGTMTTHPVEDGARFRYEIDYELSLLP
jgi:hypothetical protein